MAASTKNVVPTPPETKSSAGSSQESIGKSPVPISPLLDVSCDWFMREAAYDVLQLPHLGYTPDNHLFKAARAAAACVAGTKQFMSGARNPAGKAKTGGKLRPRSGHKRIKPYSTSVSNLVNNQYVMTLFDRSIDLARHTEETSLYVMCRSWIGEDIRQPSGKPEHVEIAGISPRLDADSRNSSEVWTLPMPSPSKNLDSLNVDTGTLPTVEHDHDSSGLSNSSCLSTSSVLSDVSVLDKELAEQSHPVPKLLATHMASWRQCRQSKLELARSKSKRYSKSLNVLKSIHNDIMR